MRRYKLAKWRLWLGAVVGAMGACLWEIAGFSQLLRPVWALVLSMLMIYACIGARPRRQWVKTLVELYGFSFLFAGIIPYVSRYIPLWIGSVLLSYGAIKLWLLRQEKKRAELLTLRIRAEEGCWEMAAMVDTGHRLKEPITGCPVIIVKADRLPVGLQTVWPIGYESVQGRGLMFGFWPKQLWVGDRMFKEKEVLVAVAREWKEESCEALIPGYLLE